MTQYRNRAFKGAGTILIASLSAISKGLNEFGNASALTFAIGEDKTTQKDYRTAQGGNAASASTIADITGSITGLSYQPDVMRIALRALIEDVSTVPIAAEVVLLNSDSLTELDYIPDMAIGVVLTSDTGGTPIVLTEGTDFTIVSGCIKILPAATIVSDDNVSAIAYTPLAQYKIKALAAAATEYRLVFNGFNTADSDKAVVVSVHRVKFSAAQALDLITDDYGELPLDFEVLADESRVVGDQFFTVKMVK